MFKFFRNLIIYFIKVLIELIENFEYRKLSLDEDDISKKILNSMILSDLKVKTDTGYESVSNIHITQPYKHYIVKTKDFELVCADNHILFDENFKEVFTKDLKVGDLIQTENGLQSIEVIKKENFKSSMFDLTVDHPNHRFYTNGILSHNTITSSITILHFVLFNNNKTVLVTANKLDTATEILEKIKEIYQGLPFFLQQGVRKWNDKFMSFENKSRIKGFATTKTASIGNTADFLYLDEFAYLPDNIAEKFYKSVFPTVSNIDNSKIIITSTPNGYNLFHQLLTDAEKPEGEKSSYTAKRVYWWQVPKRFVTYIRLNAKKTEHFNIEPSDVLESMRISFPNNISELAYDKELNKWVVNVYNSEECQEEDIARQSVNGVRLVELGEITTWKKQTIKDIGGEEAFNQEFDLRFINSSRSLLDEGLIKELNDNKKVYEWKEIKEMDEKLRFSYKDLKWNPDEEVYNERMRKEYQVILSVDISEGLGQDYSVINIFKLKSKPINIIENQFKNYRNIIDFIQLEQIGMFRSNIISVKELSELFYLLVFEHFDPDMVKVVLEVNTFGYEFLAHLPNVFEGNNNYGSSVFFRFNHRVDAIEEKIGLKVGENKNLMVKDYQEILQSRGIKITNPENIEEMTTFIKHTTNAGNVTYKADGNKNDDTVMTIINITPIFNKNDFRTMVENYFDNINDSVLKNRVDEILNRISYEEGVDYKQLLEIRRRNISYNRRLSEARKSWGLDG
jgi:hypothetical protein